MSGGDLPPVKLLRSNCVLDAIKRFGLPSGADDLLPERMRWMLSQRHSDAARVIDHFYSEGLWPEFPFQHWHINTQKPLWIELQVIPLLLDRYRGIYRHQQMYESEYRYGWPFGVYMAIAELDHIVRICDQFIVDEWLSKAMWRAAQRVTATFGRPNAQPRDEKLDRIGGKLKRRGWIVGSLKDNTDLIEEMKAEFKCCRTDVLDAASKAGLRGKRGRPKKEASTEQKMPS